MLEGVARPEGPNVNSHARKGVENPQPRLVSAEGAKVAIRYECSSC